MRQATPEELHYVCSEARQAAGRGTPEVFTGIPYSITPAGIKIGIAEWDFCRCRAACRC